MQMSKTKTDKKEEGMRRSHFKQNLEWLTFVILGYILAIIFCYLPMFGVVIAFKKYNPNIGIWASEWAGFDNFKFFFTSQDFVLLMRNTIGYGLLFLILGNIAAILLAYAFYNVESKIALKYYIMKKE